MRTILLIMIGLSSLLTADFTRDASNGIVTDSTTGLEWQDDSIGSTMTWQSAIDHCENLSLGNHDDWRLPNINELISLLDDSKYNPSINDLFKSIGHGNYWSSTTYADYANNNYYGATWIVCVVDGGQYYFDKNNKYFVRCVRAGE